MEYDDGLLMNFTPREKRLLGIPPEDNSAQFVPRIRGLLDVSIEKVGGRLDAIQAGRGATLNPASETTASEIDLNDLQRMDREISTYELELSLRSSQGTLD